LHEEHVITPILNKRTGQLYWMSQSVELCKLYCPISTASTAKRRRLWWDGGNEFWWVELLESGYLKIKDME
jgi:hypothetical protein